MANVAITLGIGGADLINVLWTPPRSVMIEIEPGCPIFSQAMNTSLPEEERKTFKVRICRNPQSGRLSMFELKLREG